MKFVVARYQENLDWTNGLSNCIVYNKGPNEPNTKHPVISLPNIGREGHTYLHHIIENYDNLDDYTCFLQGYPFDHTPDLAKRILDFPSIDPPPFEFVSSRVYTVNLSYDPTDFSLHPLLISTYEKVFGTHKTDHTFSFGAGAQFIVSRDTIRSRPKEFYQKIVPLLDHHINPPEGFIIERFWGMIFTHTE
jgi:Protein of unknown function (DUF3431)